MCPFHCHFIVGHVCFLLFNDDAGPCWRWHVYYTLSDELNRYVHLVCEALNKILALKRFFESSKRWSCIKQCVFLRIPDTFLSIFSLLWQHLGLTGLAGLGDILVLFLRKVSNFFLRVSFLFLVFFPKPLLDLVDR